MGMQGQMPGGVLGQIPNGGAPGVVMMMGPHGGMQQLPPQQQQQLMNCFVGAGGNVPTQSGAAMFLTGQGAMAGSGSGGVNLAGTGNVPAVGATGIEASS